jgi:hypothetical protein
VVGKWRDLDQPGYLEVDGVSHSGEIAAGEWIWTISATDLSTGWTERVPVMGRGQLGVLAAVKRIREQLPFELLGIHPDNGNEFLNWHLIKWCRDEKILISRSRPEHKNDNAHVEQKNWTLVRKLIGYERLDTPTQLEWLDRLYTDLLRPYNNCFQPVMKLLAKEHDVDGHLRKRYDTPTTPLRRLLDSGVADPAKGSAPRVCAGACGLGLVSVSVGMSSRRRTWTSTGLAAVLELALSGGLGLGSALRQNR